MMERSQTEAKLPVASKKKKKKKKVTKKDSRKTLKFVTPQQQQMQFEFDYQPFRTDDIDETSEMCFDRTVSSYQRGHKSAYCKRPEVSSTTTIKKKAVKKTATKRNLHIKTDSLPQHDMRLLFDTSQVSSQRQLEGHQSARCKPNDNSTLFTNSLEKSVSGALTSQRTPQARE